MNRARLKLDFDDLKQALRMLPRELTEQAQTIVDARTTAAAQAIVAAYNQHRVTGNLAAGVEVQYGAKGRFVAASRVVSTAPHAHLFEDGTVMRFDDSRAGAYRGYMPAFNVFWPIYRRERKQMWDELAAMVVRHRLGFEVHGSADTAA